VVGMARRVGDPVEVRLAPAVELDDAEPDEPVRSVPSAFLWRGRLYVVRGVLGHWRERHAWWMSRAARAVHGEGESDAVNGRDRAGALAAGREREVWRVEASAGRAAGTGVFDLSRCAGEIGAGEIGAGESGGRVAGASPGWLLLRVAD
jgi:hypothetical protein